MEDDRPDRGGAAGAGQAVAPAVRLFAPGTAIGRRYEVRGVLGMGGSAVVYEAYDRELKRRVAVKVLRTDRATAAALKRFRREVAIAREAAGSRLVKVFDIGQAGETVFLTVELVDGESLRELLSRGPLAPERAAEIGAEVLRALADLHSLGIVHRDLKPGNVLLAATGEVRLADFGLARHWEGTETRVTGTEGLAGTAEYLSPEQALGDLLDARSDLYSLGVVLFEMLAGKAPLHGDSAIGTIVAHIRQEPLDVRKLRPETPRWLAAIVARLLTKDRERRYATAADVLADLEARHATHAPRQWGRVTAVVAAVSVALVLAAALLPSLPWNRPRFERLVSDSSGTLRALDTDGRVLWSRDGVVGVDAVLARTGRRGAMEAVVAEPEGTGAERALLFLDPGTGRVVRRRGLPWDISAFGELPDRFVPYSLSAFDVNGDGSDELVASFVDAISWPCASYVYDGRADGVTVLFLSSGHVRPIAAADVDGDGRKEILFRGLANRMGMNGALAALRVPAAGTPSGGRSLATAMVVTPDLQTRLADHDLLAWYSLIPGAAAYSGEVLPVDAERRAVPLPLWGGGRADWSFDGFAVRTRASLAPDKRGSARERAYAALGEAQRLRARGLLAEALSEIETASSFASAADDDLLDEWITRVRGMVFASERRLGEAEDVFTGVLSTTGMVASVAWEAGRAFHLAGDLARAVAWYRRGFTGTAAHLRNGRDPRDLAEGMVLALGEQRRWGDALAECDRLEAGYPDESPSASWLRTYALWRSGRPPVPPAPALGDLDAWRVWGLESRWARGGEAASLLREVGEARRGTSEVRPLLDSLEAELLAALGKRTEARTLALAALEGCRNGSTSSTVLRAHLDLVAERARRLGVRLSAAAGRR